MNKNGNLKSIISSDSKKDSINEHIKKNDKNDLKNKLSEKFIRINEYPISTNLGKANSDFSNLIGFTNSNSKIFNNEKSANNSKKKYNKNNKNQINIVEEINENESNINDDNYIRHQHYKNLSNTNEKEINNLNNNINYDIQFKKNISNFNAQINELTNLNNSKRTEIIKNKINKNNNKNNNFYKNNNYGKNIYKYKKKINNNESKLDKLVPFMSSNNKNKNVINNINNNNYMNTNPNNQNKNVNNKNIINFNTDMKCNISINKKYEKSCPKLNFNKNKSYMQTKINSNIKQLNYEPINEDNNENINIKKPSIDILKSLKGNLIPYYNLIDQNNLNEINTSNMGNNFGSNQKISHNIKNDKNKNIINLFFPNKEKNKENHNNSNNNKTIGNLQSIIMNNDDNDSYQKIRINTQTNNINNSSKNNIKINNTNNLNCAKIVNKSIALRKNRTINDKNDKNNKKDFTLNNVELKKRRPRYFDSELNSNIIDSSNILGNNIKNKSTYLNLIRKAFNNRNKNYYINFMSNKVNKNDMNKNEFLSNINNNKSAKDNIAIQKSERDSKSLNPIRNSSNSNFYNEKNIKKVTNINEPYINNLMKLVNNKGNDRHYSVNQKYEYNLKNNNNLVQQNLINNNNNNNNYIPKNEIDKNKIYENIENNSLNTYSIFIFNKYYKNCGKVGLNKILIFDANNSEIPVMFYKTNADYDNGKLFNTMMTNINLLNKTSKFRDDINKNNISFVSEIKKDIYIYFYINNNNSNNIKYIKIINYNNKNNPKINPVKNIEIFKGQNIIYKGVLEDDINVIQISNTIYNNLNYLKNIYQERPFSTSKIRTQNNIDNNFQPPLTSNDNNNQTDIFHTARDNLFTKLNDNENEENYNEENYNENNIKLLNKTDVLNKKDNLNEKNNNNGNNTINIHINNNTNNITNLEIFEKKEKNEKENNSYYYTIQNSSENKYNELNNNEEKDNFNDINSFNNNGNIILASSKKKLDISFNKTNSENDYNEIDIIEEKVLINNRINNEKIKEINYNNNSNNLNKINSNENIIYSNSSFSSTFNSNNNNYIYFNKIKFIITSNYGHKKHVGLTGIEFYNIRGDLINPETAISIGALPKDLRTIYDDENDNRIFENIFNGVNNTDDVDNMWVTKLKKSKQKTYIELYFKEKIKVSKIKFYNYNEKNNLHIGAKTIELYLDDNYYGTIYLKQGIGERAYSYIKTKYNDNDNYEADDSEDGSNNYKGEDFGQIITFPIKNNENSYENKNNKFNIKHASFLYEQSYETPFMPCGYYIKFEFLSNYYKGTSLKDEAHPFKYKDLGLDSIEIYNNENINIISNKSSFKYKIISNREFHNKKNKIILNGAQNDDGNNCLFYIFEEPIYITYIKFNPLTKNTKPKLNSVKEIKIFCESKIIFEGDLYLDHPTVALFTCDTKIKKNIDDKYLTQKTFVRDTIEIKNDQYFSLILN